VAQPSVGQVLKDFAPNFSVARVMKEGYIQSKYRNSRSVLVHELVHIAQHERFEDFGAFIQEYLSEVLEFGYRHAPLEEEARLIEEALCVAKLSDRLKQSGEMPANPTLERRSRSDRL
jgi:heterodisulfide reductase subunit C